MAKSSKSNNIRFTADTSKASKAIDQLLGKLKNFDTSMYGMSTVIGGISYRLMGFKKFLTAIPGPLKAIALAATGVGFAFHSMWKEGMKAEGAILTMSSLLGSEQRALDMYEKALVVSRKTQFSPTDIAMGASTAIQFGISDPFKEMFQGVKKKYSSMDIFQALGSFRDAQGAPIGVAKAQQAIMTGNKKMARSFFGIIQTAWNETKELATQGTVQWGEILQSKIAKIPQIFELAAKQENSMAGAWSTIVGFAEELWIIMSGVNRPGNWSFWKQILKIMISIRDAGIAFLTEGKPFIEMLGESLAFIFTAVWDVLGAIWAVIKPIVKMLWHIGTGLFSIVMKAVIGIWRMIVKIVEGVWGLIKVITFWDKVTSAWASRIQDVLFFIQDTLTWFEIIFMFLGKAIEHEFTKLEKRIQDVMSLMGTLFKKFWDEYGFIIRGLADVFTGGQASFIFQNKALLEKGLSDNAGKVNALPEETKRRLRNSTNPAGMFYEGAKVLKDQLKDSDFDLGGAVMDSLTGGAFTQLEKIGKLTQPKPATASSPGTTNHYGETKNFFIQPEQVNKNIEDVLNIMTGRKKRVK